MRKGGERLLGGSALHPPDDHQSYIGFAAAIFMVVGFSPESIIHIHIVCERTDDGNN